jgi:hypothetical protein
MDLDGVVEKFDDHSRTDALDSLVLPRLEGIEIRQPAANDDS